MPFEAANAIHNKDCQCDSVQSPSQQKAENLRYMQASRQDDFNPLQTLRNERDIMME
jgi:hypothetical protein